MGGEGDIFIASSTAAMYVPPTRLCPTADTTLVIRPKLSGIQDETCEASAEDVQ